MFDLENALNNSNICKAKRTAGVEYTARIVATDTNNSIYPDATITALVNINGTDQSFNFFPDGRGCRNDWTLCNEVETYTVVVVVYVLGVGNTKYSRTYVSESAADAAIAVSDDAVFSRVTLTTKKGEGCETDEHS